MPEGQDLTLVKENGEWSSANGADYEKEFVEQIGKAIDEAKHAGEGPFDTLQKPAPPAELF